MAKRGRQKLWENCSIEEQTSIEEVEKCYAQLREELEKRLIDKNQYWKKVNKLLKKVDKLEAKYQ